MTRVICVGDIHAGPGERNVDRYAALSQILTHGRAIAAAGELGAWVLAGDVNHQKMTIDDRNALAPIVQEMSGLAPVVIIPGNHDVEGDLEIFGRLEARHPIRVVTSPEVVGVELATRELLAVACLPYPHRAGLVAAGVAHADLGQVARDLLEPVFMTLGADLEAVRAMGARAMFVGHVNVGGSIASTGQPQIGREIELDPALLARLGDVPKVLGHIHKHQAIGGAYYLGSIARMDFGEQEEKVFGVITYADPMADAPEWSIAFHPLDVPRQVQVDGRLTRDAFVVDAIDGVDVELEPGKLQVADWLADWRGCDVRVRYRFKKAEVGALDVAKIVAEFATARSLKLDPVAELEHQVRAPEVAAAATIPDKVRAVCSLQGLTFSTGLEAKVSALLGHEGAEVLTQVEGLLARADASETPAEQAVA